MPDTPSGDGPDLFFSDVPPGLQFTDLTDRDGGKPRMVTIDRTCDACRKPFTIAREAGKAGRPPAYCPDCARSKKARNAANAAKEDPTVVALRAADDLFTEHGPLLAELNEKLPAVAERFEELHAILADVATSATPRVHAAEAAVKAARAEVEQARQEAAAALQEKKDTEATAAEARKTARSEVADAKAAQKHAEDRQTTAMEEAAKHQRALGAAEATLENALRTLEEVEGRLAEKTRLAADLEAKLAAASGELETAKAETVSLRQEKERLEWGRQDAERRITTAFESAQEAERRAAAAEEAARDATTQAAASDARAVVLQEENSRLSGRATEQTKENTRLEDALAAAQERIRQLEMEAEEREDRS